MLRDVGDWTLAVARLAISDPEANQPLCCPRTGRWAVLNGAVTSAASEWQRYGDRALTRNDAELALHRLEDGGPAALAETLILANREASTARPDPEVRHRTCRSASTILFT